MNPATLVGRVCCTVWFFFFFSSRRRHTRYIGDWSSDVWLFRSDFAGYEFLNNHCFRYAGLESTRDGDLIRIDFQADIQIRTPDVDGSVYLDAKTYAIRRAELQ